MRKADLYQPIHDISQCYHFSIGGEAVVGLRTKATILMLLTTAVRFDKLRFLVAATVMKIYVMLWAPKPYNQFKVYAVRLRL